MSEEDKEKLKEYQKNYRGAKKHASESVTNMCHKYIFFSFFYYFLMDKMVF